MASKKIKCSGLCSMCVHCNPDDLSPCDSVVYVEAPPDVLEFRLNDNIIAEDERIKIIKHLKDNFDIDYRPELLYLRTLVLKEPVKFLPKVVHETHYKGISYYLCNNSLDLCTKEFDKEISNYEEVTNWTLRYVLLQNWKEKLIEYKTLHDEDLFTSDKLNNTYVQISTMIDDELQSYLDELFEVYYD